MKFDPTTLNDFVLIGTAFAAAFLATLWVSLVVWTFRDIRKRTRDVFARILAVLVVALLFLPGILIYSILRPAKTLEEEYQQTLEEEALLQTIEDIPLCPGCTRRIQKDWIVCPNCQTKLKKHCHQCNALMELPWNVCPFCASIAPGMRKENISLDDSFHPISSEEYSFTPFEKIDLIEDENSEERFEEDLDA